VASDKRYLESLLLHKTPGKVCVVSFATRENKSGRRDNHGILVSRTSPSSPLSDQAIAQKEKKKTPP